MIFAGEIGEAGLTIVARIQRDSDSEWLQADGSWAAVAANLACTEDSDRPGVYDTSDVAPTAGWGTDRISVSFHDSGDSYLTRSEDSFRFEAGSLVRTEDSLWTALSRLGAFAGSGVNTVLGFLKALASKAASTPSDIGGTYLATTDSLEAIRDSITATGEIGSIVDVSTNDATVYSYTDYTSSSPSGRLTYTLSDYANLTIQEIWFTVKKYSTDSDTDAVIQKKKSDGDIVVTDAGGLDIAVSLTASDLSIDERDYFYDIKIKTSDTVSVPVRATFSVVSAITQATS